MSITAYPQHHGHVTKCGTDTYPYKMSGEREPVHGILMPSFVARCDACTWLGAPRPDEASAASDLADHGARHA